MTFKLRPFQQEGHDFLVMPNPGSAKNHKYLAWHPGTGKSCIISKALATSRVNTLLLICPVRIKRTWAKHLVNWEVCEDRDIHIVWNTNEIIPRKPIIIISYELLLSPAIQKQLRNRIYDAIVVDEAHRAKTLTSQRSNILFGRDALIGYGRLKWLASGTPMPNGTANELYPAISNLYPECIDRIDYETFLLRYCGAYVTYNGYGSEINLGTDSNIELLKNQFKGFISFKTIEEVAPDLPPLIEKHVYLDVGQIGGDIHDTPISTLARLIGEAKVHQAQQYISDWIHEHNGERLLVFAYHREVIKEIARLMCHCCERCENVAYLFGGQSDKVKQDLIKKFCRSQEWLTTLILQVNAAGEAIDGLQHHANHIIRVEPDWSPGVGNQAFGRLYRIGQTKPVYCTTLVAENTLDETKIFKYDKKQGIIDRYFDNNDQLTTNNGDEKRMSLTETQFDRLLSLGERLVDIIEYSMGGTKEEETKTTKRGGRGGKKTETAAQTQTAETPIAPSAPPAEPGANATVNTSGVENFQDVINVAKATKERIVGQIKALEPTLADDAVEAKAIAFVNEKVIKANGFENLGAAETANDKWLNLTNALSQIQYVGTTTEPNKLPF